MLASLLKTAVLSVSAAANAFTMHPITTNKKNSTLLGQYDIDIGEGASSTNATISNTPFTYSGIIITQWNYITNSTQYSNNSVFVNAKQMCESMHLGNYPLDANTPDWLHEDLPVAICIEKYEIVTSQNLLEANYVFDNELSLNTYNNPYTVRTLMITTTDNKIIGPLAENNSSLTSERYLYNYYRNFDGGKYGYNYSTVLDTTQESTYTYSGGEDLSLAPRSTNYLIVMTYVSCGIGQGNQIGIPTPNFNYHSNLELSGRFAVITDAIEVIDIPTLMFTILTMPFSFVSQAFNLTLFPGTNYQINIARILLTLFAIAVIVIVLLKVFKK